MIAAVPMTVALLSVLVAEPEPEPRPPSGANDGPAYIAPGQTEIPFDKTVAGSQVGPDGECIYFTDGTYTCVKPPNAIRKRP